jgi:hypothetical protein
VVLSCPVTGGRHDGDTSVPRGGDDEDDPDMSLQSTAALAMSPLHKGSGDGSSSKETPRSPAFRLLFRLSLRSRLAIWHFLYCTLFAACLVSAAACFWLKFASSGEAPWQGQGGHTSTVTTRNHDDQPGRTNSEKINTTTKGE